MYPTILGFILFPLAIAIAGKPLRLMQLALVAAVFEAGAALVLGNFGLQPALVPGLLFMVYVTMQYALGMRYPGERLVLSTLAPLILLLAYALLSIAILPEVFAGQVLVAPQKADPLGDVLTPLEYTSGNLTQTLYLAQNVVVAVLTALFLTRVSIPYQKIMSAYLLGGYIELFFAFWQFASRTAGLPFPDDVLYSNPGWAIVEQAIGEVPRIQGTFSEPAGLAVYLIGMCFCSAWLVAKGHRVMRPGLLLGLSILTLLISTSTTAMVCLFVGLPLELAFAARSEYQARARIVRVLVLLTLGGCLAIGPALVLKPDLLIHINEVVEGTLSKQESSSYKDRTALDQSALQTVSQTYGFGVGWGSFRSSSLIPGLLANGGVFGVALLIWLGINVVRLLRLRHRLSTGDHPGLALVDGFSAAMCGQLVAAIVSAPSITSVAFYLQLGCLVGAAVRMCLDARRARPLRWRAPAEGWGKVTSSTQDRHLRGNL